ncbi:LrgB family protein, partial [Enterobacter hormaechei]|uniref:LrgB family protein n=1 Tax=Enterobacter hormaechei TaxID=158836 RepID=UPI003D6F1C01
IGERRDKNTLRWIPLESDLHWQLGMIWREGVYLSHGAGTARSYELGQQEGVVASLVVMLSGVTMVLIAPLVAWVMF